MFIGEDRHLTHEAIALYVDALKLDRVDKLPDSIRNHVAECQRCKQEVIELESLVDDRVYRNLDSHPTFGPVQAKRGFPLVYRIAATILIVIGIGSAAYLLGLFEGNQTVKPSTASRQIAPPAVRSDSSKASISPEVNKSVERKADLAANFTPSPNLEGVVGSALRAEEVNVVSPSISAVVHGNVVFRWETGVKPPFTLKVLNNREVEEARVSLNAHRYVLRKHLNDGLYYWKLEAGGELLYVGKFLVKGEGQL